MIVLSYWHDAWPKVFQSWLFKASATIMLASEVYQVSFTAVLASTRNFPKSQNFGLMLRTSVCSVFTWQQQQFNVNNLCCMTHSRAGCTKMLQFHSWSSTWNAVATWNQKTKVDVQTRSLCLPENLASIWLGNLAQPQLGSTLRVWSVSTWRLIRDQHRSAKHRSTKFWVCRKLGTSQLLRLEAID